MSQIYEIGESYEVTVGRVNPDYFGSYFSPNEWVPLIGEKHCDTELIYFPLQHYHVDWRFVKDRKFKKVKESHWPKGRNYFMGIVIIAQSISEIKIMRMKMLRQMPEYPNPIIFTKPLEQHYQGAVAKKHRCPHQGADLSSIAPNEKGQIVCPLHGLRFCKDSLKIIMTTKQEGGEG
jgi:hypothetical protein